MALLPHLTLPELGRRARGERCPARSPRRSPSTAVRDGFVRTRVMAADAARAVRAEFGRLHGWEGEGFSVDFWADDQDYRVKASSALSKRLDGPIRRLFVDHQPFLRSFLVKWPGLRDPLGFPEGAHRDWMYTDERMGMQSYVVWVSLEDVTGHNGQLKVARGSHRLDDRLRGTSIDTEWLDHTEVWDERMLAVPTRAGEAVITHGALVHGSHSNLTDEPRVAAAVAVRPSAAPLVHYRRINHAWAAEFRVDEQFFVTQDPALLMSAPPDLPVARVVPMSGKEFTSGQLARRLDRSVLTRVDRGRLALTTKRAQPDAAVGSPS